MEVIEVFKTNVETAEQAGRLIELIHENFPQFTANFDLDDCDRILRIKSAELIRENSIPDFLQQNGFDAAVLEDEIPPFIGNQIIVSAS
ncbi:MAG: hypothetical protein JNJ75_06300 [Cyclobacteriaceae bacterium]|nr:hypothetical protein [Cyclobacteriaceae bacterium]